MAEGYNVRFARDALADLEEIGDYMAQARGLDEAEALLDRLRAHAHTLAQFPLLGSTPKELDGSGRTDIRQIIKGRHRMFYRVDGWHVTVFMIMDGRRDIDTLLTARLLDR